MNQENLVEKPRAIFGAREDRGEKILARQLGKKYIDYRKKWIKASQRKIITDFPLYIQIEHSGKCNLRCLTCVQGIKELRENYSPGFKPLEIRLYKKILREAQDYKCPSMSFHNNDEPLLLKDLEKRIKMAKEAGFIDIILVTNATLLTKERADNLLKSGITKINFSVDGWNEKTYRKVRIGGDFKAVLKNIEYFLEQKKQANLKLPVSRVTSVLSKFTCKDMDKFRDFWKKRVDLVEFQNFQAIEGYTERLKPGSVKIDKNFYCNNPWQQIVIRANGDVLPCCSFCGTSLVVGNIKKSSIYQIWHSPKMNRIRKEILKNNFNFSRVCKSCSETAYIFNKKIKL